MIIDFSERLESSQNNRLKNELICQCLLESFIAATQEINSILIILKNENISPSVFVEYVEKNTDRATPHLLERLTGIQGKNLLNLSKKLNSDLAKLPQLSSEELKELSKKEKSIGADYFMESNPIIVQKMNKYMVELLEMDSI